MDKNEFIPDHMTGQLVPVINPTPDATVAFVPNPLPPSWDWSPDLRPLLVEARKSLASLDGTGRHLPNPEILLHPLQQREAQLSSQLEGTITDPAQQVLSRRTRDIQHQNMIQQTPSAKYITTAAHCGCDTIGNMSFPFPLG